MLSNSQYSILTWDVNFKSLSNTMSKSFSSVTVEILVNIPSFSEEKKYLVLEEE